MVAAFQCFEAQFEGQSVEATVRASAIIASEIEFFGAPFFQGFGWDIELSAGEGEVAVEAVELVEGVDFGIECVAAFHVWAPEILSFGVSIAHVFQEGVEICSRQKGMGRGSGVSSKVDFRACRILHRIFFTTEAQRAQRKTGRAGDTSVAPTDFVFERGSGVSSKMDFRACRILHRIFFTKAARRGAEFPQGAEERTCMSTPSPALPQRIGEG